MTKHEQIPGLAEATEVSSVSFSVVVYMMFCNIYFIYIVRCVSYAWGIFSSDTLNLYFFKTNAHYAFYRETTLICAGRANTSDVSTPQACHIMPSVIRLVLIDDVLLFISAIKYELLL
jgi:hypothetical protein